MYKIEPKERVRECSWKSVFFMNIFHFDFEFGVLLK